MKVFKYIGLFVVSLFVYNFLFPTVSKLPDDVKYTILDEVIDSHFSKCNLKISINKKIDEATLGVIASELRDDNRFKYEKLWIFYYIKNSENAWASTHFIPELDIDIFGSTNAQDEKTVIVDDIKGEIIGKWRSEKALLGSVIILYKIDNEIRVKYHWANGSEPGDELVAMKKKINRTIYSFGYHGEYYIIEQNGNLGMYGENGKFDEAVRF